MYGPIWKLTPVKRRTTEGTSEQISVLILEPDTHLTIQLRIEGWVNLDIVYEINKKRRQVA